MAGKRFLNGLISSAASTFQAALTCSSTLLVSGIATIANRVCYTYITSPPNLTSSQNDWNPGGFGTAVPTFIRFTANAGLSITGIIAGQPGQVAYLMNVGGTNATSLPHLSGSSSANNRLACPNNAAVSVRPNGGVLIIYDGVSNFWRVIAP